MPFKLVPGVSGPRNDRPTISIEVVDRCQVRVVVGSTRILPSHRPNIIRRKSQNTLQFRISVWKRQICVDPTYCRVVHRQRLTVTISTKPSIRERTTEAVH
jgi:hypothetical protein